jgi:hypothetical protein
VSGGLSVIVVDLQQLRAAVGSGDADLQKAVERERARELAALDVFITQIESWNGETEITGRASRDLLRHMVIGGPYLHGMGYAYRHCLEIMADVLGRRLPGVEWSGVPPKWFATVQAELTGAGVDEDTLRVEQLGFRGDPVPLPGFGGPRLGYWTRPEVALAQVALAGADLSLISDEVSGSVRELGQWLTVCVTSDRDLLGVYNT